MVGNMFKHVILIVLTFSAMELLAAPLYWRDANGVWPVWQSDSEVAVFSQQGKPPIQSMLGTASLKSGNAQMQIWQLPRTKSNARYKGLAAQTWSPIFYEYPNQGGRKMALAGGVMLGFKQPWSHANISTWLQQRGLVARRLHPQSAVYVIESPAGLDSLRLANNLSAQSAVEYASPNWWIEVQVR